MTVHTVLLTSAALHWSVVSFCSVTRAISRRRACSKDVVLVEKQVYWDLMIIDEESFVSY